MTTTFNDMPHVECPHCGHKYQWDDYYAVDAGDELECPKCEKTMHVHYVETTINVTIGTEPSN